MNLSSVLKTYGLKDKETQVYLACLQAGSGPVHKIAELSQVPRSTCYEILETLNNQGLVSVFQKKKIKWFTVEDPRVLARQAKEKTALIESSMDQLLALYGQMKNRPAVRVYEGKVGMKIILEEILNEATELLSFSSYDDLEEVLGKEWPEFVKQRLAKKIPAKVILRNTPKGQERKILGVQELRDVRFISPDYNYHGLTFVWKNKITMFSLKNNLVALVIESPELAETQRNMFYALWDKLPS